MLCIQNRVLNLQNFTMTWYSYRKSNDHIHVHLINFLVTVGCRSEKKVLKIIKALLRRPVYCNDVNYSEGYRETFLN